MNHSLVTADRTTHLKIVAVSLVAAIAVILVGMTARITDTGNASANLQAHGPVVKAGKPAAVTRARRKHHSVSVPFSEVTSASPLRAPFGRSFFYGRKERPTGSAAG